MKSICIFKIWEMASHAVLLSTGTELTKAKNYHSTRLFLAIMAIKGDCEITVITLIFRIGLGRLKDHAGVTGDDGL